MNITVDAAEALRVMAIPKRLRGSPSWKPRSNHAGHMYLEAQFEDDDGAIIGGLTLQIEIKAPIVVSRCLYLFTLFLFKRGSRARAYQLEVAPASKRTHNGREGSIHGPHEHIGEEHVDAVSSVGCHDFEGALAHFAHQCSIRTPTAIPLPKLS